MQNKDQEREYFDEFTSEKPWNAFTDKTYDRIVKLFVKYLNPKKEDKIIDMGCGTGELAEKIYQSEYKNVIGLDISKNCIELAEKRFNKKIKFEVKDIEKTKLKPDSVDILFFCGILHHFTNQSKVIKESFRILKKGGKVFVFEPNTANPVLWLFRSKNSPIKSSKLKTPNEEFMTKNQVRIAFRKENFIIENLDCVSNISYTKEHFKKILPFPFYFAVYGYNLFEFLLNLTPFRKNYGSFIFGYMKKP